MHVSTRFARFAVVTVLIAGGPLAAVDAIGAQSSSAAAVEQPTPAGSASAWLLAEASDGVLTNNGEPDAGLMADAALAAAATGHPGGTRLVEQLAALAPTYVSPANGVTLAGPLAKLLLVADVWGLDPSSFGGVDLRAELLARLRTGEADPERGRFSNVGTTDSTNLFSQALAVIALSRTGAVPPLALEYLDAQRCPGGGFRAFLSGTAPCVNASTVDPDATAIGLQALIATNRTESANDTRSALLALQGQDGSFRLAPPSNVANSNTTGLAAQALRSAGSIEAADRAGDWIASLQLSCADGPAALDAGAFSYDTAALAAARTAGITNVTRDQFRRATAQAVLAFDAPGLHELDAIERLEGVEAVEGGEATDGAPALIECNPGPTTTTTTTTSTAPTTTVAVTTTTAAAAGAVTTTTVPILVSSVTVTAPVAVRGAAAVRSSTGAAELAATGTSTASIGIAALLAVGVGLLIVSWSRRRA